MILRKFYIVALALMIVFVGAQSSFAGLFSDPVRTTAHVVAENKTAFDLSFIVLTENYKKGFDELWNNPDFTPQEVVDAWGIEAGLLFLRSELTKSYILSIDPEALSIEYTDAPMTVTVNPDGTVTLS